MAVWLAGVAPPARQAAIARATADGAEMPVKSPQLR
jgi:hypothetical protein